MKPSPRNSRFRFGLVFLLAGGVHAADSNEFFEKKIRPVLAEQCYLCHSSKLKTPMGGLRLDTRDAVRKGGDTGPAIVPGDPDRSLLLKAISYRDVHLKMPPAGKLTEEQIADFRVWIEMGAPDPRSADVPSPESKHAIDWNEARKFWAFQPVRKHEPPAVKNRVWVRSPVDAFILARLEQQELKTAPPAEKRDWLRRVTFDLTGLPPTPADVDAFLSDNTPAAYEKVVDRLLASPRYGERWARHWLDLVRFAETNGHEYDNDKLDAWRYRDYVIRAFNQDQPYNQFVREHIAGDLIDSKRTTPDGAALEAPVATGAFWFGEVLNSATDSVKSRADQVDNQLDVFGKAFLGLTVACARCHDHKFDPIPTADYYSLAGIMHSTAVREAVIDSPERAREIAAIHARIGENTGREELFGASVELRSGDVLVDGWSAWTPSGEAFRLARQSNIADSRGYGADRLVGSLTSAKFRMPKLYVHVLMAGTKTDASLRENTPIRFTVVADDFKSLHLVPKSSENFEWHTVRATKEIGRICYFEIVDRSREGHIIVDRIVLSDSPEPPQVGQALPPVPPAQAGGSRLEDEIPESAFAMIAYDESPQNVKIHIRGNHKNLGEEVPRGFLRVIAGDTQPPVSQGSGRLELAERIASERNPLTARVMVNRIWTHHFGQGIVASTDNFGKTGDRPIHPELLDYLAARFVESGWSVKAMHRLILLSSAYGMSSRPDPHAARVDPANKLLHHVPVRRLEAEAIRDAILSVTGTLNPQLYGPSVPPHISKYQDGRGKPKSGPLDGNGRRSIYIQARRNFLTPMLLVFDYPLPISSAGNRSTSTVPSQALLMMNNEFVSQAARRWAETIMKSEIDAASRIERMYLEAFSRPPDATERSDVLAFIEQHGGGEQAWADAAHVLLNSAEFIYLR